MSSFNQLTERAEQVVADIQQLQATEKQLLADLEDAPIASAADRAKLTQKINEVNQLRLNAYEQLQTMFSEHSELEGDVRASIKKQVAIAKVVDGELAELRRRLAVVERERAQKIRIAEVNSYYADYYDGYKYLAQIIVFTCVPLILFGMLSRNGLLPSNIYGVLAGIILVIGGLLLFKQTVYLSTRGTTQWNVINWGRMPSSRPPLGQSGQPPTTAATASMAAAASGNGDTLKPKTCVGSACCDSVSAYDATTNKCVEILHE